MHRLRFLYDTKQKQTLIVGRTQVVNIWIDWQTNWAAAGCDLEGGLDIFFDLTSTITVLTISFDVKPEVGILNYYSANARHQYVLLHFVGDGSRFSTIIGSGLPLRPQRS